MVKRIKVIGHGCAAGEKPWRDNDTFTSPTEDEHAIGALSLPSRPAKLLALAGSGQILNYLAHVGEGWAKSVDVVDYNPTQLALFAITLTAIEESKALCDYYHFWQNLLPKIDFQRYINERFDFQSHNARKHFGCCNFRAIKGALPKRIKENRLYLFERSAGMFARLKGTLKRIEISFILADLFEASKETFNGSYDRVYLSNLLTSRSKDLSKRGRLIKMLPDIINDEGEILFSGDKNGPVGASAIPSPLKNVSGKHVREKVSKFRSTYQPIFPGWEIKERFGKLFDDYSQATNPSPYSPQVLVKIK